MDARLEAWAASGAMSLTGRADREPLGPPSPLVDGLQGAGATLARLTAALGTRVDVDPLALLGERAALTGLTRQGAVSCGGGTRLLDAADGVVAVALARDDDVDLVPAWLELVGPPGPDVWATVTEVLRRRPVDWIVERGTLLGLAVAALGTGSVPGRGPAAARPEAFGWPIVAEHLGRGRTGVALSDLVVVDLSVLWAGPLCGQLLVSAGARVVKVESTGRPDGARSGPAAFFDLLNADKRSVALDFTDPRGRELLHRLVATADVVIESSRPRALEQLGVHARDLVARDDGPGVWISITGYGRTGPGANRIAYGDVAAVAGGLVVEDHLGPCFCADAIADPMTGLVAAVGALEALASGERWLLDVAMVDVAARGAGPTRSAGGPCVAAADDGTRSPQTPARPVAPPRAREPAGAAPALGCDTESVLAGITR